MVVEKDIEKEFLRESNFIEGEYSDEAFADAWKAWLYLRKQKFLNDDVVKNTHAILMRRRGLKAYETGEYRTVPVYIGGRLGLNPQLIEGAMKTWLYGQEIEDWKMWHVEYERIHPFVDGNGRTGRMFMNWHRRQLKLPILVVKESEKQDYYKWFAAQ